jgi:hypothetical protein
VGGDNDAHDWHDWHCFHGNVSIYEYFGTSHLKSPKYQVPIAIIGQKYPVETVWQCVADAHCWFTKSTDHAISIFLYKSKKSQVAPSV